jgi:hypothetical protein
MLVLEPAALVGNHRVYMMQDMLEALVEVILLAKAMAVVAVQLGMPAQVVMVELMAGEDQLVPEAAAAAEGHIRRKVGQWVDVLSYLVKAQMGLVARQAEMERQAAAVQH